MEGLDPDFATKIKDRAIIVAGKNFGCGSSREQAPIALKYAGVKCVIAESFARIFYRNAVNIGLPVVECKGISRRVEEGDELSVNLKEGTIKNKSKNTDLEAAQLPEFMLEMLADGGLVENLRKRMKSKRPNTR
jgi:3-isopropylmalate/(R)-2-methylmalate dehydratase small subunit